MAVQGEAPSERPVTIERRTLTTLDKLKVLLRYSRCPVCGEKFNGLDDIDWDHIGQVSVTNDNSLENFRPLHRGDCHKAKTARDAKERARTRHLERSRLEREARAAAAEAAPDDEPDRVARVAAGDDRGRYKPLTIEEKRERAAARKGQPMRRKRR